MSRQEIKKQIFLIYFIYLEVILTVVAFVIWLHAGLQHALLAAGSVLMVAFPSVWWLSEPVPLKVAMAKATSKGIIFHSKESLQAAGKVTIVAFDKASTLTVGKPEVTDIIPLGSRTTRDILMLAASLELSSEHSLAESVVSMATTERIELSNVESFRAIPGHGVEGVFNRQRISLGNRRLMLQDKIDITNINSQIEALESQGKTVMILAINGQPAGLIAVADVVKENALAAITALRNINIETVMVSGDNKRTAEAVAKQLGIGRTLADVLPSGKAEAIQKLRSQGKYIAMVGGSASDAPALAAADIGIALGSGFDAAADIILTNKDLTGVATAIILSRKTLATIRQNYFWAAGYYIIFISLAMGVLRLIFHVWPNPIFAFIFLVLSSGVVVANSLRLNSEKSLE